MHETILYSALILGVMAIIILGKLLIRKLITKDIRRQDMYILLPVDSGMTGTEMHLRSLLYCIKWGSCDCRRIIVIDKGMGRENIEICQRIAEKSPIVRIVGECAEIRDII